VKRGSGGIGGSGALGGSGVDARTWERLNAAALSALPPSDGIPARHDVEVPLAYETAKTSTTSLADVVASSDEAGVAFVRRAFRVLAQRPSTPLTETQRRCVLLHLDGVGVVDISRQLGINHSAASRAIFGSDDRVPVRIGAYEVLSNALISDPVFLQEAHDMAKNIIPAPPVRPQLMATSAIAPAWFRKIHRGNIDQFGFFAVFLVLWSVSKDGKLAYSDACRTLPASIIGPTLDVLKRFPHRLVDFDGVTITIRGTPVDDVIAGES
jgi:hypothetical protein